MATAAANGTDSTAGDNTGAGNNGNGGANNGNDGGNGNANNGNNNAGSGAAAGGNADAQTSLSAINCGMFRFCELISVQRWILLSSRRASRTMVKVSF